MSFEAIKNGLEKLLPERPEVFAVVLACVIGLAYTLVDKKQHPEKYKTLDAYTVKVVDEKGNTTVLYKHKTVEIENGVIYVCPLQENRFLPCTDDKEAIKLTGNFIIEKQP